jgi:hypothetical protein
MGKEEEGKEELKRKNTRKMEGMGRERRITRRKWRLRKDVEEGEYKKGLLLCPVHLYCPENHPSIKPNLDLKE